MTTTTWLHDYLAERGGQAAYTDIKLAARLEGSGIRPRELCDAGIELNRRVDWVGRPRTTIWSIREPGDDTGAPVRVAIEVVWLNCLQFAGGDVERFVAQHEGDGMTMPKQLAGLRKHPDEHRPTPAQWDEMRRVVDVNNATFEYTDRRGVLRRDLDLLTEEGS